MRLPKFADYLAFLSFGLQVVSREVFEISAPQSETSLQKYISVRSFARAR